MAPQYGLRSIEFPADTEAGAYAKGLGRPSLKYITNANFPFIRSVYVFKFVVSHLDAAL